MSGGGRNGSFRGAASAQASASSRGPGLGGGRGSRRNRQMQGGKDEVLFARVPLGAGPFATVICCVDDTDDLSGLTSTGAVAERIARCIPALGGQVMLGITRHQLLLADGVPYTSHNSSMAFMAKLPEAAMGKLHERAVSIIEEERADGSDPGLCLGAIPPDASETTAVRQVEQLEAFGRAAQERICTKEEAYALAASIPWLMLGEHGGTGDGVIGALAGAGLRLSGADGRFRGQWDLADLLGHPDASVMGAGELSAALGSLVGGSVHVVMGGGEMADAQALVRLSRRAKPVLCHGALTLAAAVDADGVLRLCETVDEVEMLAFFDSAARAMEATGAQEMRELVGAAACTRFAADNDDEECAPDAGSTCRNCLYRRWTARGFHCVHELAQAS